MMKTNTPAITVKDISKYFEPSTGSRTVKQLITSVFERDTKKTKGYWALRDINFEVNQGEFFGIVGRNGSGKSTLLKMIAGVYTPTSGAIQVNGKLVPFIELGVGFNPELSARDNVFLNGALLGFSRKEMLEMYDEIVDFSELADHMEVKLKNFSSGMQVRLAFSIAIRAKSDILLIDEVLAVGDAAFQTKCFDYFSTLKKSNKTVIFVSHDRTALERFCEKGVLINDGKVVETGTIKSVLKAYNKIVLGELESHEDEKSSHIHSNKVELKSIHTSHNQKKTTTFSYGEQITFSFDVLFKERIENPILGITVWDAESNKPIISTNTLIAEMELGTIKNGSTVSFEVSTNTYLNDAKYIYEVAVANNSGTVMYAQSKKYTLQVNGSNNPYSTFTFDQPISIKVKS